MKATYDIYCYGYKDTDIKYFIQTATQMFYLSW